MPTGTKLIRLIHPAHKDCLRLLKANRDRKVMRRHALKLRFWPDTRPETDSGEVLDLDWSWVQACKGLKIGELRIHDNIAGFDNWRIMFFEGDKPSNPGEMSKIWIIQILKKKRNDFTDVDLKTLRLRRLMVIQRYYEATTGG